MCVGGGCISGTKYQTENEKQEKGSPEWKVFGSISKINSLHYVGSATATICLFTAKN